jgi:hypothetical protein
VKKHKCFCEQLADSDTGSMSMGDMVSNRILLCRVKEEAGTKSETRNKRYLQHLILQCGQILALVITQMWSRCSLFQGVEGLYRRSPLTMTKFNEFLFIVVQMPYIFSRNQTSNFDFGSFFELVIDDMILSLDVGQ